MARYLYTVAYDGSSFSGWQIQKGANSIQEELERALGIIAGKMIRIHGSGRTDAGVHALGQVFHADIPDELSLPEENWPQALNTKLPYSIRVLSCRKVADDFHARYSALGKTYLYCLSASRILMPFDFNRVGHYPHPMNGDLFEACIREFSGTHDFNSFAAVRGNEPDPLPEGFYVRTVTEARADRTPCGYDILFTGNGFLYKMVRLMVGTAHAVARGKLSQEVFRSILHEPSGQKSRYCAVPHGLSLMSVQYPE